MIGSFQHLILSNLLLIFVVQSLQIRDVGVVDSPQCRAVNSPLMKQIAVEVQNEDMKENTAANESKHKIPEYAIENIQIVSLMKSLNNFVN